MKKYIAVTALSLSAAVLLLTAGCGNGIPTGSSDQSSISDLPSENHENNSTAISQSEPESSAPEIPKGEPTFLICPDGTPVYTSEISEIYAGSEFDGNLETLTLEQAEQRAKECEGEFNVTCEGYAYGLFRKERSTVWTSPKCSKTSATEKTTNFSAKKTNYRTTVQE